MIVPLNSTIFEPFCIKAKNSFYFVDTHSNNDFVKIFNFQNKIYKEYTGLKIKDEYKRKFFHFLDESDINFMVGVEDNDGNLEVRLVSINGKEIVKS